MFGLCTMWVKTVQCSIRHMFEARNSAHFQTFPFLLIVAEQEKVFRRKKFGISEPSKWRLNFISVELYWAQHLDIAMINLEKRLHRIRFCCEREKKSELIPIIDLRQWPASRRWKNSNFEAKHQQHFICIYVECSYTANVYHLCERTSATLWFFFHSRARSAINQHTCVEHLESRDFAVIPLLSREIKQS